MFAKEILGTFKCKRTRGFILLMFLVAMFDFVKICTESNWLYAISHKEEIREYDEAMYKEAEEEGFIWVSNALDHPATVSLLSGASKGHIPQFILIWLLPLFVLNIYSDRYVSETKRKYTNALYTRSDKWKVFLTKSGVAFVVPFVVYGTILVVNFLVAQVLFFDGYNFSGYEVFAEDKGGFFAYEYNNPNITYFMYLFLTSLIAGLCGVIGHCISFVYKNYVVSYMVTFMIWLFFIMSENSIVYAIQPFTEYGLDSLCKSIMPVFVFTAVTFILSCLYLKNRRNEIA